MHHILFLRRQITKAGIFIMAAVLAHAAIAQGSRTPSPVEFAREADKLKPGQWVWAPQVAPKGPVLVFVDLSRQTATVYRNGVRIGVTTVSTGKAGHATPTGVFSILQKDANHHSSTYDNAPMPFQQRLTWDGVALHAGGLPDYPESHGCVHLPYAFAKLLFGITASSTTVVIAGDALHPVETHRGDVLAPSLATPDQASFWAPERAPAGPVTIVMSRSDQRVSVLRNGVEIGRAAAINRSTDDATHVLTLGTGEDGKPAWIYVGVTGHADEDGRIVDEATRNRVQIAQDFLDRVTPILSPGTTLLVTQAPLGTGATGAPLTVMDDTP